MVKANGCPAPYGPAKLLAMGPANEYYRLPPDCPQLDKYTIGELKTTAVCDFSKGAKSPDTVWLVGDSHAEQWQGPLIDLARERRWILKFGALGGCPFAKVQFTGYRTTATEEFRKSCTDWTAEMSDVVAADRPAKVFVSFFSRQEFVDDGTGRSQTDQYRDGVAPYWRKWTKAGARVIVLADPPLNGDVRPPECVTLNPNDPAACAVDRHVAQPPDPLAEVARASRDPQVSIVDLTDYFCDDRKCYSVIGNVVVYFDPNHVNMEYSRSLTPILAEAIDKL
jgi:hypothetical protein